MNLVLLDRLPTARAAASSHAGLVHRDGAGAAQRRPARMEGGVMEPGTSESLGTCDWGNCDEIAVARRHDELLGWLPVCEQHRDRLRAVEGYFDGSGPSYEGAVMEVVAVHEVMQKADDSIVELAPIRGLSKAEAKRLLPVAVDLATYALAVMRGDIEANDEH